MANLMDDDLLSSDSEDDDYVPTAAEVGSEDELSGEEEDLSVLGEADTENAGKGKRKKGKKNSKKAADLAPRKRAGGIKLEDDDAAPTNGDSAASPDNYNEELVKQIEKDKEVKKEVDAKKKADSLWDDFMKDVGGPKPKPVAKPSAGLGGVLTSVAKSSPKACSTAVSSTSSKEDNPVTTPTEAKPAEKITITKEYDFAGETVRITKEVSADSKEAKEQKKEEEGAAAPAPKPSAGPSLAALGIGGIKRPGGGLGSVLGKIGKKQKISTLDKSKLDWDNFKRDEGISEDLATHNKGKDGYIERQQFLQRTDLRQFEIERELRIKNRKPFTS